MRSKVGLAKSLFLFVTPLVTGSVFVTLPTQAATLARADAFVDISNFSQSVESASTSVNSVNSASDGNSVTSIADTDAVFLLDPGLAVIHSSSEAVGRRGEYFSVAKSDSTVVGNFFIDASPYSQQSLAFNFDVFLNLETSIERSHVESASAATDIALFLIDTTDRNNHLVIDSFSISGELTTIGDDDLQSYEISNGFTVDLFNSFVESGLELQRERTNIQASGSYNRNFDSPTHLSLVVTKQTEATVTAPEPSSNLALFMFSSLIGIYLRNKRKISNSDTENN